MTSNHFDSKKAARLDNPERAKELRPLELFRDVLHTQKGMTCVDFGAGTGVFALPLASIVGERGKVYAVDDSLDMLAYLKAKNPPPNLVILNRDVACTGLENNSADICLLAFILHEVKQPEALIAEAYRILKSGGKVAVVEWKAELASPGPPQQIRLSKNKVESLFKGAGLMFYDYINWTEKHYVITGGKT